MSLILYPKNETAFDNNGIGILSDVVDDEVYEELNGQYELTVQYPVDGLHFGEIVNGAIITAKPDPVSDPQPFQIYRITKPMKGIVTIYARHIAYKNRKITVSPFTASSAPAALQSLKVNAVNSCPFEFWTDKTTAGEMAVKVPSDIWTLLGNSKGSVLDTYGGEYEFDGFTVKLWSRRGADRGVTIRYGKNLTSFEQDENIANVYTGVYPYWKDMDGNLVQLPEKYVKCPGTYDEELIMPLDLSQEFETQPTEEQLRARTEKYISDNDIGKPAVSWTVEFVQLEQTEEYKGTALLERVLLGDTVSVIFTKMGVDVSARAVAVRYKPTLGRYKSITLGKVKANLASTIAQQGKEIQNLPTMSEIKWAQASATSWLTNGKGYKVERRDAAGNTVDTLYLDTPDINTAVNILRIGQSGIGFSRTGINGPFISAFTIDGKLNADLILAGTIYGIQVKAGTVESDDGKIIIDLSAGAGEPVFNTGISTNGLTVRADAEGADKLFQLRAVENTEKAGEYYGEMVFDSVDGSRLFRMVETYTDDLSDLAGVSARWNSRDGALGAKVSVSNDLAGFFLYYNGERVGEFTVSKDGTTSLQVQQINGKTVSWNDNGDGTHMLIGT